MRSTAPMPGNPWPHDMSITIEDRPHALLELLWIREAYRLRPHGDDLPPLLSDTPTPADDPAISSEDRDAWEAGWPRIWQAALQHAGLDGDPRLFTELHTTADGSPERADILHRIVGPDWRDEFGDSVFNDDSYRAWSTRNSDAHVAALPTRLEDQPERRDLQAVIPAWRAGLTRIVTIPCTGEFTRRISGNALLMTSATRESSERYRRALSAFT